MTARSTAAGPPDPSALRTLVRTARDLVAAITFDDSGSAGRGGNGGLISRETIRKTDELRIALLRLDKAMARAVPAADGGDFR